MGDGCFRGRPSSRDNCSYECAMESADGESPSWDLESGLRKGLPLTQRLIAKVPELTPEDLDRASHGNVRNTLHAP